MTTCFTEIESKRATTTKASYAGASPTIPRDPESGSHEHHAGFSKVFRWPVPADQVPKPTTVEVLGSFNGWRKLPLSYDPPTRTWQITVNHIEGNRTHRYVCLVDGKPSYDKTCDGLVDPRTAEEAKWAIATPRGLRLMLLFSQTK